MLVDLGVVKVLCEVIMLRETTREGDVADEALECLNELLQV